MRLGIRAVGYPKGSQAGLIKTLLMCLCLGFGLAVQTSSAQNTITEGEFSEESPPSTCRNGYAVKGIECRGGYCDNKRLICEQYGASRYDAGANYRWSRWFSEEGNNRELGDNELVSGMGCSGRYCDNLQLRFLRSSELGKLDNCEWMKGKLSEEEGRRICPNDKFVAGIECQGGYCDNLFLYCCDPTK